MKQAEDATAQDRAQTVSPCVLTAALQAAFSTIGARLPPLWGTQVLAPQPRKARLRCLRDQVTWHRVARSQAQVRLVGRGGETTTFLVPVNVKSLAALPWAAEMAPLRRAFVAAGHSDEAIAQQFTERGHRSPSSPAVLPKTVRIIR